MKTCFLYFFQLVGIKYDDTESLEILFAYLVTKKSKGGQKEMSKSELGKISFDLDKIAFLSKSKSSQAHVRIFKRFCKVLITNLVDVFPAKKKHMYALAREILNFSRCKMRLFRSGFTQIGLCIFSQLLTEVNQL